MPDASVSDTRKRKKIGRPAVGSVAVMLRLPPQDLADLDRIASDWTKQTGEEDTRQDAIRRLILYERDRRRPRWEREDERAEKRAAKSAIKRKPAK